MNTTTIWPDTDTGVNRFSFASCIDRVIAKGERVTAFEKLENVSQLASAWMSHLSPWTWGRNLALDVGKQGWTQNIYGKTVKKFRGDGRTWVDPLSYRDLLRSLSSMNRNAAGCPMYCALGTCDGYKPEWRTFSVPSACVPCLRVDIDTEDFCTKTAANQYACIETVAQRFGMPWSVFATGGRGAQAIFRIPETVTTVVGVLLVDALKEALRQELAAQGVEGQVDCDNLRSLMRLPLMPHGKTHDLGLFFGRDGLKFGNRKQFATGLECFAPAAADNPFTTKAQEICAGLNPDVIPSDRILAPLVLRFGTECLLFAPQGHSTVINDLEDVATPQTSVVTKTGSRVISDVGFGFRTRGELLDICNRPVEPGTTWFYMTRGWGAWAHVQVYGVEAEARLRAKLELVPGWDDQRSLNISYCIANNKTFSPLERTEYSKVSSLPRDIEQRDTDMAVAFADTLGCNAQRRRNAVKVKTTELHILRHTGRTNLSGRDIHRVCQLLYGAGAPSQPTCGDIYWKLVRGITNKTTNNIYSEKVSPLVDDGLNLDPDMAGDVNPVVSPFSKLEKTRNNWPYPDGNTEPMTVTQVVVEEPDGLNQESNLSPDYRENVRPFGLGCCAPLNPPDALQAVY